MTVWLQIEDVSASQWKMSLVNSQVEATQVSSSDAQQAMRAVADNYPDYRWKSIKISPNILILRGESK
jgi:hypothetical protein